MADPVSGSPGTLGNPVSQGVSDALTAGPVGTYGFGPREQIDETRQAQHGVLNDTVLDVDMKQVIVRDQALTQTTFGKVNAANFDRREKIWDTLTAWMQQKMMSGT